MMQAFKYGHNTKQILHDIANDRGVSRLIVIMRHSERHYDHDNAINEPFMGLTESGKALACEWGAALPAGTAVGFFSSYIGRCIETAYLMDKGYVRQGGETRHNTLEQTLSPYYVRDVHRLFKDYTTEAGFFRQWFAGDIQTDIIAPPKTIAQDMAGFLKQQVSAENSGAPRLSIGITHDWNLYVARHHLLGLAYDAHGKVEYLDGIAVYEKGGQVYVVAHGTEPMEI
ncbi:MAG: histidine phosphatase family protein [Thermodesulfobacteriota bacterium]|nr:histidine phosphatase family protein [Thermodesulfobacteriota bacterium]